MTGTIKTRLVVGALAFAVAWAGSPVANSQIKKQGDAYTFRMLWTKGAVYQYDMTVSATLPGGAQKGASQPPAMSIPFTMTVKDVKNGVATVEVSTRMQMPGGGKASAPQTQTIRIDQFGRVVDGSTGSLPPNLAGTSLPDKPVRIGGTWSQTQTVDSPMGGAPIRVNATYRLQRVRTVNGREVAEISMTSRGEGGGMSMSGSGTMTLLTRDGSLFSADITMTSTMTLPAQKGGQPQSMSIPTRITIRRK